MNKDKLNVLLAYDDSDDRLIFKEAMEEINIETMVYVVNDGIQLFEFLKNNEFRLPDILFLDINMPGKNGIECLNELRQIKEYNDIVIVIYSTSGTDNDIKMACKYGANQYLRKPNNYSSLKLSLYKVLSEMSCTAQISL